MSQRRFTALARSIALAIAVLYQAAGVQAATPTSRMATFEKSPGESYFALSLASQVDAKSKPTDVVILFDTSASQVGQFREQSLEALKAVLNTLSESDRVKIMAVDLNAVSLQETFSAPQAEAIEAAMKKLEARVPLGTTDLSAAMQSALKAFDGQAGSQRAVVYIGDGMSRAGRNGLDEYADRIRELVDARIAMSSLAIGPGRDVSTLAAIANHTGGQILAPGEEFSSQQAGQFMARSAKSPVIWPKSVTYSSDIGDVYPKAIPPLRLDRDTIVVGTLKASGEHTIDFVGELAGETVEMQWQVKGEPSNEDFSFLPGVIDHLRPMDGVGFPAAGSDGLRALAESMRDANNTLVKLGSQALSRGDLSGARQTAEAVLKRDPNNAEAQTIALAAAKTQSGVGKAASGTGAGVASGSGSGGAAKASDDAPLRLVATKAQDGEMLKNFEQNEGKFLFSEEERRRLITQRTQAEVEVELSAARQKMGSNPESANHDLKAMLEQVEKIVEIDADVRSQLRTKIESAIRESGRRAAVESERRAGQEALRAEANQAARIAEATTRDQEKFKQLMDRFNALMDERRYREAEEQVANQLRDAAPDNSTAQAAIWSARSVFHINEQERLFDLRHRNFALALHEVEEAHIPFPAEPPINYPSTERWDQITRDRAKYKSVDLAKSGVAETRILKALGEPIDLDFTDTPLRDVMDYIETTMAARNNPIQIELDTKALEGQGVGSDTPITRQLKGVSLRSALRLMLKDSNLTYVISDEVLLITTQEEAETRLLTKVYPVADLVIGIPSGMGGGMMGGGMGGGMGGMGGGMGGMGGGMGGMGGGMGGMGGGMFAAKEDSLSLGTKKPAAPAQPQAEEPRVRKPRARAKSADRIELSSKGGKQAAEAWNDYFANTAEIDDAAVRATARDLMEKKQHAELVSMLQAAIRSGKPQPWMYEAIGLAMQASNAPIEELERALMSAVDFASSPDEVLFVGAYLARSGLPKRALSVFQNVAINDPYRPEPYMQGLKAAQAAEDLDGIQWACVGLLNQQWTKEQREVGETARRVAEATLRQLRQDGRTEEADRFEEACKQAMQRDCVVVVRWTGDADIDLMVVEPSGSICSLQAPRTIGGGVISGDSTSRDGKSSVNGSYEAYICPRAFSGEYKVLVKKIWGKVTTGQVTVEVITHAGTADESYTRQNIPLSDKNAIVTFDLKEGRRKETIDEQQIANVARNQFQVSRAIVAQALSSGTPDSNSGASDDQKSSFGEWQMAWKRNNNVGRFNVNRPGAVGYMPLVQQFPEGNQMSAQAIVSADRRYVRFSMFPMPLASGITEVSTFNFVTGQGGQQGGGGAGGGGGGAGGGGGGIF